MVNDWFQEIPSDPLHDLHKVSSSGSREQVFNIVNGIDARSNRPVQWNPLQLVMTWNDETKIRAVAEELVLMGADMNKMALCGLNPLHILLLLLFYRNRYKEDEKIIEWWLSKGVDVHAYSVIFDRKQKEYRILSPLDILLGMYSKTLSIEASSYLPAYCVFRKRASIRKASLKRLVGLLLCYGARSSERCDLLEEVHRSLTDIPLRSLFFLRDYIEVRLKLPLHLTLSDIRQRVRYLQRYGGYADHDEIVQHRKELYFDGKCNVDEYCVYSNPDFEDAAEFMPYEYLGYVDMHRKHYYFHKTMVPSLLQSKENPFTRESIPLPTLRQWFHAMSDRPYIFQQLATLRETVTSKGLVLWNTVVDKEENKKNFVLHFAHSVLAPNFPYTNIHHISTLPNREIRYLCNVLSNDPYLLTLYSQCPAEDALVFFSRQTILYLMNENFPLDLLHFGIEDAIQDISCFHLVNKLLRESTMTFEDSFLDIITSYPEVGDVIRDRLGYVHLGYFHEIWQRLVFMERNFS